ncbi:hypothetical protein NVP1081O_153 [Vibrio phage 1.081.O._10N.286.52.C2]|nr:hypothetical protein NVP1081O_153 [Vibrio phage 1.081.O._10N.286.52.C2]
MIDNMIRDMLESEYSYADILDRLVYELEMPFSDAYDALHEIIREM